MGQALYRKYRSKSLDEIVGQEHVTTTLRRAIETGRISHAYLFTGPRGVGKTSIARILAHELNGVPYTGEDSYLDIIEIDAASNGGVEEVRDLRDKVYIAPANGKFKVYIIDEVHMMTTSAFNALLKTLEEPPAHTVFILATTEAHKLPATIISRTQRFTFKPIERAKMVAHLKHIAEEEKIDVADEALELLAEHSEGSFRDAIQMLDQAGSSCEHVDKAAVEALLGIPSSSITDNIINRVVQHDAAGLASLLADLRASGYQASAVAKQLGQTLRAELLAKTQPLPADKALSLLTRLIDVPASHNADQLLEIVLLAPTLEAASTAPQSAVQQSVQVVTQPVVIAPMPLPQAVPKVVVMTPAAVPVPAKPVSKPAIDSVAASADDEVNASDYIVDAASWQALLEALKKQYNTLYGIIRMAQPEFTPGRVTLTFGFAFHQKRANDAKNKKILTATLESITGQKVAIDCKFDKTATPPAPVVAAQVAPAPLPVDGGSPLGAIGNIFGGGEVISSP